MKREKHVSYSSHDSCKNLSEELSDYYRGRHSSHTKHHSQRREKDRSDAILSRKGIGQKTPSRLGQRFKGRPQGSHEPQGRFQAHGPSISPLIFVNIRIGFSFVWALYFGHLVVQGFSLVFRGILSSLCSKDFFFVFSCFFSQG